MANDTLKIKIQPTPETDKPSEPIKKKELPDLEKMSLDQIEAHYDFSGKALLEVAGKDPNYSYRWCDARSATNIQTRKSQGYEKCIDENNGITTINELVLMRRPKRVAEAHRNAIRKQTEQKMTGIQKRPGGLEDGSGITVDDQTTRKI